MLKNTTKQTRLFHENKNKIKETKRVVLHANKNTV
jgi:hypothetical protein